MQAGTVLLNIRCRMCHYKLIHNGYVKFEINDKSLATKNNLKRK